MYQHTDISLKTSSGYSSKSFDVAYRIRHGTSCYIDITFYDVMNTVDTPFTHDERFKLKVRNEPEKLNSPCLVNWIIKHQSRSV